MLKLGWHERIIRQSWVRYYADLDNLAERPDEVALSPLTETFVNSLRTVQENSNQLRSAIRFWDAGLKDAYVWFEKGEPLCMQWLIRPRDLVSPPNLGDWAGMYPPVPENCAMVENIYSFAWAQGELSGAATRFALAVFHEARRLGFRALRTHIPQSNLPAHRWARRTGLKPFGIVDRYAVKIPGLSMIYACHHQKCEVRNLQPRHRQAQPA